MGRALTASLSVPNVANHFHPEVFTLVRRRPAHDRCVVRVCACCTAWVCAWTWQCRGRCARRWPRHVCRRHTLSWQRVPCAGGLCAGFLLPRMQRACCVAACVLCACTCLCVCVRGREVYWDPYEGRIDTSRLEGFDAFVNLAGQTCSHPCRGGVVAVPVVCPAPGEVA